MEPQNSDLEEITKGKWQWRSNPDPWSKSEESQWESYSLRENYLIEKGYYDGQKEVDLGDYIIYPQDKLQRRKENAKAQRPIRRIDWMEDEEMNDRSERYFETELPKTMNIVHGNPGDFTYFFANRNPAMQGFAEAFQVIVRMKDLNGLKDIIIPGLVESLEKELIESSLEEPKNSSLSLFKRKILLNLRKENKELISLFQRDFTSVEEFYGQIFRAYTMNTSLCPKLNRCLRNEDWIGMENLLPYAYCLCAAFSRNLELFQKDHKLLKTPSQKTKFLYRGTAFDEFALSSYNKKRMIYFGWNSLTSTSTNKQIAEDFMYQSANPKNKRYPVMFIIEVPTINKSPSSYYLRWMQIHQFSILSKENETVLPPGSIFKLEGVSKDKDEKITIRIKLRDSFEDIAPWSFTMANRSIWTGEGVDFSFLKRDPLYDAVRSISGNRLIQSVHFKDCEFDGRSLNELRQILPTLERVKELTFFFCSYQNEEDLSKLIPKKMSCSCDVSKAQTCQMDDFCQIIALCFHICRDQNDFMLLRPQKNIVELHIIAKSSDVENRRKIRKMIFIREISQDGLKKISLNHILKDGEVILDEYRVPKFSFFSKVKKVIFSFFALGCPSRLKRMTLTSGSTLTKPIAYYKRMMGLI